MSKTLEVHKQTIQALRSKINDERQYYRTWKEKLSLYHPDQWAVVEKAIVGIAQYYHGEIVRAKHDLADWMSGHDVKSEYGHSTGPKDIHETVDTLWEFLEEMGRIAIDHDKESDEYKAAAENIKDATDFIRDIQKQLEEIQYSER